MRTIRNPFREPVLLHIEWISNEKDVISNPGVPISHPGQHALRFCLCVECCQDRDWRMSRPTEVLAGDHNDLIPEPSIVVSSDTFAQYQFTVRLCEKEGIDKEREV
jgi:hypothetical protein